MNTLQIAFARAYKRYRRVRKDSEDNLTHTGYYLLEPRTLAQHLAATVRAIDRTNITLEYMDHFHIFDHMYWELELKQERRKKWLRDKLGDNWNDFLNPWEPRTESEMNLKQKAEVFLAEFKRRTGVILAGDRGPKRVRVYQTIAGLTVDGDAGPLTFGHLEESFQVAGEPVVAVPDGFPDAPLCSVEHDGVFPMAEDRESGEHNYRVTSGFKWERYWHYAQDITEIMPDTPVGLNSDGVFGAPEGSRVVACLPGIVVDIDMRGDIYSIVLKHNTVEFGLCYSLYMHIDGPAPGMQLGDLVQAGEFIAWNGTSGTTLRHLHWSFHVASKNDQPWKRDAWNWLQSTAINLGGKDWDHHNEGWLGQWRRVFIPLD